MKGLIIRKADTSDQSGIWSIFSQVVEKGDTYVFPTDISRIEGLSYWLAPSNQTFVATLENKIVGTYILKQNQIGLGAHICNASYMIHPDFQRMGLGKILGKHSLDVARAQGFHAMQFNFVVGSNNAAIRLWQKLGFEIVGTVPDAFRHRTLGLTDAHIMHKKL